MDNKEKEALIAERDKAIKERDALIELIKGEGLICDICKHYEENDCMENSDGFECLKCRLSEKCPCTNCGAGAESHFEWKGIVEA